jgi:hypothetical protein
MIVGLIVGCEIGFWVCLAAGLGARYVFHAKKTGAFLLALSPVVDLVLLVVTAIDLRNGGEPGGVHGLAALYIGLSVAHGRAMIRWADDRAAYWAGRAPKPAPAYGAQYTAICWRGFARTVAGCLVAWGLIAGLGYFSGNPQAVTALNEWIRILGFIVLVDGVWAVSYTIAPRKQPQTAAGP